MSNDNKTQGLTATQKISLVAGTLPVLYLLPSDAKAAIIFNDSSFSTSYDGPTSVEWDVDGDGNNDFVLEVSGTTYIDLDSNEGRFARGVVRNTANAGNNNAIQNLASGFVVGPTLAAGYSLISVIS